MSEPDKPINGNTIKISTPLEEWAENLINTTVRETVSVVMKEYAEKQKTLIGKVSKIERNFYLLVAFLGGVGMLNAWSLFLR